MICNPEIKHLLDIGHTNNAFAVHRSLSYPTLLMNMRGEQGGMGARLGKGRRKTWELLMTRKKHSFLPSKFVSWHVLQLNLPSLKGVAKSWSSLSILVHWNDYKLSKCDPQNMEFASHKKRSVFGACSWGMVGRPLSVKLVRMVERPTPPTHPTQPHPTALTHPKSSKTMSEHLNDLVSRPSPIAATFFWIDAWAFTETNSKLQPLPNALHSPTRPS